MEQHPEMLAQEGKDRGWGGVREGEIPTPQKNWIII